jgi:hypothetical protein
MTTLFKTTLCVGALAACLQSAPALAQVEISVHPPAFYVATTAPVYYEGHASYWYGNRWHYREGGEWRSYHDEPSHLREHREHHESARQYYGRGHGEGGRRR